MKHLQNYIFLLLAAFVCLAESAAYCQGGNGKLGLTTICIDPGHGGNDPGCVSRDGKKTAEKTIVLSVGLKVRTLLNERYPDMKVVMTRSEDKFIPLGQRAAIANKANAGLFISIHVNALDPKKNKNYRNVSGFSIHTLGQSRTGADLYSSNMELCKRENSVILMEDDYSTTYQGFDPNDPESYIIFNLMQNANLVQSLMFAEDLGKNLANGPVKKNRGISQDPFLVLWKTTMPAVLIECGFMTNASDLAKMSTDAGREEIAERIVDAIVAFKTRYDASLNIPVTEPAVAASKSGAGAASSAADSSSASAASDTDTIIYGTQVLASGKKLRADDPFFKGYSATSVWTGKIYKYIIGTSASLEEARAAGKKIRASFPDSFLVKVENGSAERVR